MPAFRIVYIRTEATTPETIITGFNSLEHALDVFAARGLRIVYIAEQAPESRRPATPLAESLRKVDTRTRSSFPIRRFSARVMA